MIILFSNMLFLAGIIATFSSQESAAVVSAVFICSGCISLSMHIAAESIRQEIRRGR